MEHAAPTPVPETLPNPNLQVMLITVTAGFPVLGHVPDIRTRSSTWISFPTEFFLGTVCHVPHVG